MSSYERYMTKTFLLHSYSWIACQRNRQLQARCIGADNNETCCAQKLYKVMTDNSSQLNYLCHRYLNGVLSDQFEIVRSVIVNILNKYGIFLVLNHRKHEKPRICLIFEIKTQQQGKYRKKP